MRIAIFKIEKNNNYNLNQHKFVDKLSASQLYPTIHSVLRLGIPATELQATTPR
ncbi:hypothetical protein M433DRAFT_500216 [Acidomyces richmondensis BFW]|nr:MAG: hypothetical protein FE78DRAFT_303139 [Acidomyces sp. 'richmondensis']KYG47365.1 hypothetical protein M433DRAFT_500216 [Acidomyces richmondensis BFW]